MTTVTKTENRATKTNETGAEGRSYFVLQVNIVETKDSSSG